MPAAVSIAVHVGVLLQAVSPVLIPLARVISLGKIPLRILLAVLNQFQLLPAPAASGGMAVIAVMPAVNVPVVDVVIIVVRPAVTGGIDGRRIVVVIIVVIVRVVVHRDASGQECRSESGDRKPEKGEQRLHGWN